MAKTMTVGKLVAEMVKKVPAGWRAEGVMDKMSMFGEDWDDKGRAFVRFTHEGGRVVVVLNLAKPTSDWTKERAYMGLEVEGDTLLDGGSFIRRGVDCSCCSLHSDPKHQHLDSHAFGAVDSLLRAQLARCEAAIARRSTAVPVPGLPFTVQPDWFAKAAQTLRAGESVRLTPHGFGTGYVITRQRPGRSAGRYGQTNASPELVAKIGVGPLVINTIDCD